MEWFAVRHVIEHSGAYEERVTLWEAATATGGEALDLFQSYRLADPPTHGREVFSLIRTNSLPPEQYLDTFFDSGQEHQRTDR